MSPATNPQAKSRKSRKESWPRIHKRKLPSGQIVWVIDTRVDGERIFRRFATGQEADDKAAELRTQRQREGKAAFGIPAPLRIEAAKCSDMLLPYPDATITQAVTHYVE